MLPVSIPFNDLNDLLSKVSIVELKGETYSFKFSGFSRSELESMLADPKCDGIVFLPAILEPENTLTLLAVAVDDTRGGIEIVSPAILSDCPPRCKEQPAKEELVANFIPRITLKTSVV